MRAPAIRLSSADLSDRECETNVNVNDSRDSLLPRESLPFAPLDRIRRCTVDEIPTTFDNFIGTTVGARARARYRSSRGSNRQRTRRD